jgi:hypothetical protein
MKTGNCPGGRGGNLREFIVERAGRKGIEGSAAYGGLWVSVIGKM